MTVYNAFKTILVTFFIVVGFYSCEKEFATVAASGIVDTTAVNFKSTYSKYIIRSKTLKLNPVQSNNLPIALIGNYNNPEFGSYSAEFVTQLRPSQFNPIFADTLENLTIDKVILSIPYFSNEIETLESGETIYELDSIVGNKENNSDYNSINISVFESNYFIRDYDPSANEPNVGQKYYSNKSNGNSNISDLELEKELLLEINDLYPDPSEIQIRDQEKDSIIDRKSPRIYVEFDNLDYWRTKIIEKQGEQELANINNFNDYFRGLYFKVTSNSDLGFISAISTNQANIEIQYSVKSNVGTTDETVTNKTYNLNLSGNKINFYNNALNIPDNDNNTMSISGTDGSIGVLELFSDEMIEHPFDDNLPDISVDVEELISNEILINEANIIVQKTGDSDFEPNRIFIYNLDDNSVISDYNLDISANSDPATSRINHLSTLITDTINGEVQQFYRFRITNHIKNIVKNDSTNVKIGLSVSADVNLEANGLNFEPLNQDYPEKVPVSSIIYPKALKLGGNETNELSDNIYLEIFYTEQKQ
ncbi:MAG: DUF4270 domain-containing protein [Flavobacteriaceae bacterium]